MKLAVFSDTHSNIAGMLGAVRRVRPDVLVHLGDHIRDTAALTREFPELPLHAVAGNCDFSASEPDTITFAAGPITVFATHGHRYSDTDALCYAAESAGAKLALYGHTHIALWRDMCSLQLLNPGSAGKGIRPSFAVVEISDTGAIVCRIMDI
ncbi:MAG: metallophosphoesterase family protein [Oscillospiraceae bacterium]